MRAIDTEEAAIVGVGVHVGDGLLAEFVGVGFEPLDGTEQAGFFAIPRTINDGALGLPTSFDELAERARLFQNGSEAGDWIFGAIHPGVVDDFRE